MKEALYWTLQNKEKNIVRCSLCPHGCVIAPGKTGICRARKNVSGGLFSLSYGELTSINLDPIEKKPLYNFYPGTKILSAGSFGCNFRCSFCQNWEISQSTFGEVPTRSVKPSDIVKTALDCGSIGIAYTYNEPFVNFEWMKDTSKLAREKGLVNVIVSNGYVNPEPLSELIPFIDAANIDIKAFTDDFYNKLCGAKLAPVLGTVSALAKASRHVEVTTLLIPGENDSTEEIDKLSAWIADLSPDIPLHFSRYFPAYNMDKEPTGMNTLERAWVTAKKHLRYVYVGNVSAPQYSRTQCPACGEILIERNGYDIKMKDMPRGCCPKCGIKMDIKSQPDKSQIPN